MMMMSRYYVTGRTGEMVNSHVDHMKLKVNKNACCH